MPTVVSFFFLAPSWHKTLAIIDLAFHWKSIPPRDLNVQHCYQLKTSQANNIEEYRYYSTSI